MNALNRLGVAIAIGSLSLTMLGCGQSNNSSSSNKIQPPAENTSNTASSVVFTDIDTLSIADYSLDKCIKETGHKYIENIIALRCNNKGIQFLEGIEQLTELKILHLNYNKIYDITPLVNLKELQTLYLSGNEIQNLDSLSELKKLTELGIEKNKIEDLSPLQSLSTLKSLHTHSNKINDFSILSHLELDNLSGTKDQKS